MVGVCCRLRVVVRCVFVRCLGFVVCCLRFVVWCVLADVCRSSFDVRCLMFVGCRWLFGVCCLPCIVAYCVLIIAWRLLCAASYLLFVVWCM